MSTAARLTWNRDGPAPYESAWLVALKLEALNLMHWEDILSLAENAQLLRSGKYQLAGVGVDTHGLANLMGVPEDLLKTCFTHHLGIDGIEWRVRHCEMCMSLGYHCALFAIPVIARCPWHGTPLEPCPRCTRGLSRAAIYRVHSAIEARDEEVPCSEQIALECGHFRYRFANRPAFPCPTPIFRRRIKRGGDELVAWFARAKREMGVHSCFLPILLSTARQDQWPLVMGLAEAGAGAFPWPHNVASIPARAMIVPLANEVAAPETYLSSLRSLRRRLFRGLLRTHGKCLKRLSGITSGVRFTATASFFCPISACYAIWCASLNGYMAKLRAEEAPDEGHVHDPVMAWMMSFFELWHAIEVVQQTGGTIRYSHDDARYGLGYRVEVFRNSEAAVAVPVCSDGCGGRATRDRSFTSCVTVEKVPWALYNPMFSVSSTCITRRPVPLDIARLTPSADGRLSDTDILRFVQGYRRLCQRDRRSGRRRRSAFRWASDHRIENL